MPPLTNLLKRVRLPQFDVTAAGATRDDDAIGRDGEHHRFVAGEHVADGRVRIVYGDLIRRF